MEIKSIKCPNCSSPMVSSLREDTFQCNNCHCQFKLFNPSDHMVTHVNRKLFCPICGSDIEGKKVYKCRNCGKENICEEHMLKVYINPNETVNYCADCMKELEMICSSPNCGRHACYICNVCGKRYCHTHLKFEINTEKLQTCNRCNIFICKGCLKEKIERDGSFTYVKYNCPKCGRYVCLEKYFS